MGITGLWDIIGAGEVTPIADLAAEHFQRNGHPLRIAIDEAHWRFHTLSDAEIRAIRMRTPESNPREKGIVYRILPLLTLHIQLLFVFDGPGRPEYKQKRILPKGYQPHGYHGRETALLKDTLDALGIPHHQALGEAEAECAALQKHGIVDAVWSEDSDTMMFGCRLYSVITESARWSRTQHGLDSDSLALFASLSGGDYHPGLQHCGPRYAMKAVQAGFGGRVHQALDMSQRARWRRELGAVLNDNGIAIPPTFPNEKVLSLYLNPHVSSLEQLETVQQHVTCCWDAALDEVRLKKLLAIRYNLPSVEEQTVRRAGKDDYRRLIEPIFFVRAMAGTAEGQEAQNDCYAIAIKHSKKNASDQGSGTPSAVTVNFVPSFRTERAVLDNNTERVECETLACIVQKSHHTEAPMRRSRPSSTPAKASSKRQCPDVNSSVPKRPRGRPRKDSAPVAKPKVVPAVISAEKPAFKTPAKLPHEIDEPDSILATDEEYDSILATDEEYAIDLLVHASEVSAVPCMTPPRTSPLRALSPNIQADRPTAAKEILHADVREARTKYFGNKTHFNPVDKSPRTIPELEVIDLTDL